jgi:kynurenine formamidase
MNLLNEQVALEAAGLVKRGATFPLDAAVGEFDPPLDSTRAPARHRILRGEGPKGVDEFDDVLDDYFPQISSQWDSLAHAAANPGVFYNGASVDDVLVRGANTIDHWARRGIVTRGVLLDVARGAAEEGVDTSHGPVAVTVDDLERARSSAGVEYSNGCVLVVRTGFIGWYRDQGSDVRRGLSEDLSAPGLEHTEEMARYLWDAGLFGVASDSFATEVWPPDFSDEARPFGYLHRTLIGRFGMAIGELWDLDALATDCGNDGVHEFLLVSAPLNVRGGIGSPANALALK